jgi:hypothetical protein
MGELRCVDGTVLTVVAVACHDRAGTPYEITLDLRRGRRPFASVGERCGFRLAQLAASVTAAREDPEQATAWPDPDDRFPEPRPWPSPARSPEPRPWPSPGQFPEPRPWSSPGRVPEPRPWPSPGQFSEPRPWASPGGFPEPGARSEGPEIGVWGVAREHCAAPGRDSAGEAGRAGFRPSEREYFSLRSRDRGDLPGNGEFRCVLRDSAEWLGERDRGARDQQGGWRLTRRAVIEAWGADGIGLRAVLTSAELVTFLDTVLREPVGGQVRARASAGARAPGKKLAGTGRPAWRQPSPRGAFSAGRL